MLASTKSKYRGFTIVELLIVIVVIAILAAITIVAYNGIQTRGNNSAAATAAVNVSKKLEAYNALYGNYPASGTSITTQLNATTQGTEPNLTGSGITLSASTPSGDARRNTVKVQLCFSGATPTSGTAARGFKVFRYDFSTSAWQSTADQSGGDSSANCFETTQNVTQ